MTLEILTSDSLNPVRHGFFTRKGGASLGIFKGLNCGHGSSDQADLVSINRALVAQAMAVNENNLHSLFQIHSADVLRIDTPVSGPRAKGDAMVTNTPGIALGILTADCLPVLFADQNAGVIAAAHAGWKGALGGVLQATVEAMIKLGATCQNITATVGPAISQRAYEVGPEFFENFLSHDPDYDRFFAQGAGDRLMFDLPSFGLFCLRSAGVSASWTGHCTFSDPDRFYSYRRTTHAAEADYGRLISAITL